MKLADSVITINGVGIEVNKKLQSLGIQSIFDLLNHLPRRYNDFSNIIPIASLKPGMVTVQAKITQAKGRYMRRGMHITEAIAEDASGSVRLVWFNQPYRENSLKKNQYYFISGDFKLSYHRFTILNPAVELVSDFPVNTARIIPIYPETSGLSSSQIRKLISQTIHLVDDIDETLPEWIIKKQKILSRTQAYRFVHYPKNANNVIKAHDRLGFEEIFCLTLAGLLNKQTQAKERSLVLKFDEDLAKEFVAHLPFKLTDAQRRAIWQIYLDLEKPISMNRMLEGDVGSGKTVVAAMVAIMVIKHGLQVAFMAPTELLANQHAKTIHALLKPLGMENTIGLITGGMPSKIKTNAYQEIEKGKHQLIIGTHALIQEKLALDNLGLVIIDEQHRFGVDQRKQLLAKSKHAPHVLTMTATPIPRSLALTLYGELEISVLAEKPKNRKNVITKIISPNSRDSLYKNVHKAVDDGKQIFVVCPLITESTTLQIKSAEQTYVHIKKHFSKARVGLLHGRLKAEQKDNIMQRFIDGQLDILVTTTVIEVGVDVPNATIMLIEAAERFGLAQLHQLRGRVGRGLDQGHCYLITSDSTAPPKRLRALEQSNDGFKLAELDLELRGPGAIYGTHQHGQLDLRVAKLTDIKLINQARGLAQEFIDRSENLLEYKELSKRVVRLRAINKLN